MTVPRPTLRAYAFPMILMLSILLGGATGYFGGEGCRYLKPLGDIFLNLIFTSMVPLIFFSIASAIARTGSQGQWGRILSSMTIIFILTGIIAASLALLLVLQFPPAQDVHLNLAMQTEPLKNDFLTLIAGIFTVPQFSQLLSHQHMLALIVFSILVGIAASAKDRNQGPDFIVFLQAGEDLFMRVFSLIMWYAPVGFFAYFAVIVHTLGPALLQSYMRVTILYSGFTLVYLVVIYSAYAYWSGKKNGVFLFWKNSLIPAATSLATCSSAASIPANLVATRAMGVPPQIVETVIPLGAMIHKDGSVIGGMIKIAFLFGLFHLKFAGASVLLKALGVSFLVGTVMGAIPSGGMLGELLILSVYGFPSSALMAIAAISIIIDPLATLLNVLGNSVSSMMIARLVNAKRT